MFAINDRVYAEPYGRGTVRFTSEYSVGQYCDVVFDESHGVGNFRKVLSAELLPIEGTVRKSA